jgi:hypothetical protein
MSTSHVMDFITNGSLYKAVMLARWLIRENRQIPPTACIIAARKYGVRREDVNYFVSQVAGRVSGRRKRARSHGRVPRGPENGTLANEQYVPPDEGQPLADVDDEPWVDYVGTLANEQYVPPDEDWALADGDDEPWVDVKDMLPSCFLAYRRSIASDARVEEKSAEGKTSTSSTVPCRGDAPPSATAPAAGANTTSGG